MATQPGSQPRRPEEEAWGCVTCAVKVASEEVSRCANCGGAAFRKYPIGQLVTMGGPVAERRSFG